MRTFPVAAQTAGRPEMLRVTRFGPALWSGLLGCLGCMHAGASPPAAPPLPEPVAQVASPVELPPLSADALGELREAAPEVARDVERVHALARRYAAAGERDAALELGATAEHLLRSTAAWIPTQTLEGTPDLEAAEDPGADAPRPSRRRDRARAQEPVAYPVIGAPPVQVDEAADVRRRLSRMANEVAEIRTSLPTDQRVALEGVETALIQADRALSEGLQRRAEELAEQAERLLQGITGENRTPSPESKGGEGEGFFTDARKSLGERAIVRGGVVAVRLDGLVHYRDKAWSTPENSPLDGVRSLVRGYREVGLSLVTVGPASHEAFSTQRDALREHLSSRFQISSARVSWRGSTELRLEPGTYLILDHGAAET